MRLGALLRDVGVADVSAEDRQAGRRQIDVRVRVGHVVVAVEAEIANRAGAIRDAQARLDQGLASRAVAVSYPSGLRVSDFDTSTEVEWAVLPDERFVQGTAEGLAAVLQRIQEDHGDAGTLADDLDESLDRAVGLLSRNQRASLAVALDLPLTQDGPRRRPIDRSAAAAKRALLVVAAATMFHARLDGYLYAMRPTIDAVTGDPYVGDWPPAMVQACLAEGRDPIGAFSEAWRAVLAVDYRPIFETALVALRACAQDSAFAEAVRVVGGVALRVARDAAGARHDLLGRIFHRILDSARYDGSFYTATPAAVLLAGLSIRPEDVAGGLSTYRLIDPACGTGTLLMAAAERIRDVHPDDSGEDGARMIDSVVWGIDVNTTACHLAATTLGLLAPSVAFSDMNIHLMPLRVTGGGTGHVDARLGSLELLNEQNTSDSGEQQFEPFANLRWYAASQVDSGQLARVEPNSFQLVIMNPPYTRDSLRHDQFSKVDHDALKAREKQIMAGRGSHGSSAGSMFEVLGEHLSDLDNGVLAMVRPTSAATGPAGLQNRKLLANWFHVEWVISSHDPSRIWFSENTSISEMLVVARRHGADPADRPPTKFVSLMENPATVVSASALASSLTSDPAGTPAAAVTEWSAQNMIEGDWSPVMFANPWLAAVAAQLRSGQLLEATTVRLESVASVGPAGRRIRDVFKRSDTADVDGYDAMWRNDTNTTRTLGVVPDFFSSVKPGFRARHLAANYWAQRGNLLISTDPRLTTLRVLAVHCDPPTLGSRWVPCTALNAAPDVWSKAMVVWLNSSLGILATIAFSTLHTAGRLKMSQDAIRNICVPALTDEAALAMAAIFENRQQDTLLRLAQNRTDETRLALDAAVIDILGADPETVTRVRNALADEPSVK